MTIVWTQGAQEDLQIIFSHIAADSTRAAYRTNERILKIAESLALSPLLSRALPRIALRELVVDSTPYTLRYSLEGEYILITRVRHGAMNESKTRS